MSKNKIIGLVAGIVIVVFGFILIAIYFATVNNEAKLRNLGDAQQSVCKQVFDKTWKVLDQKVQVLGAYREDFKTVVLGEMTARYQGEANGSPIFKFIHEHNIAMATELYKDVMDAIESNRAEFLTAQKRLTDVKLQHDNMLVTAPWNMFLAGKKPLEIKIITSSHTEDVYVKGKDDNVNLGLGKK